MKIKVYIGCPLTYASKKDKHSIKIFKQKLKKQLGHSVEFLEFIGDGIATSEEVYIHDIHNCVKESHLFLVIQLNPSTGLGYEAGAAIEAWQKSTMILYPANKKLTRVVAGAACSKNPQVTVAMYQSTKERFDLCVQKIEEVYKLYNT